MSNGLGTQEHLEAVFAFSPSPIAHRPSRLPPQPVVHFYEKDVVRVRREQRGAVAGEVEIAGVRELVTARLGPDEEERRARPVLPAIHDVAEQRARVEARVVEGEGRGGARTVRI